jgi:chromate transporter
VRPDVWVIKSSTDYEDAQALHWFEAFYRTGSIIFGGGQVGA